MTYRTKAQLLALFADNTTGDISAGDADISSGHGKASCDRGDHY